MPLLRLNLSLVLSLILLCFGILQIVRPFSAARVSPGFLIAAAVLVAARHLAVRQRQKRAELLRNVPKHPLGLTGDDET